MDVTSQLQIARKDYAGGTVLSVSGVVDGADDAEPWAVEAPVVIVDLAGVKRVTSFGTRRWTEYVDRIKAPYRGFARCTPPIVDLFTLYRGAARQGPILSLLADYECPACDARIAMHLTARDHWKTFLERVPPPVSCAACGADMIFDGVPERFAWANGAPPPYPTSVEALLAEVSSTPVPTAGMR